MLLSGNLDTSFSNDGKATVDFGSAASASAVLLQPDNKTLVIGTSGNSPKFSIARFNAAGALDNSFGNGAGKVVLNFPTDSTANAAALEGDGKILIAGSAINAGDGLENFRVVRLNANGSVDTTFGAGGNAIIDFGGVDIATGIAIQKDGKIVVTGQSIPAFTPQFAVARLNANGQLDKSFSGDGKFSFDFGINNIPDTVTIQSDQKILIAGTAAVNGTNDFAVARVNTNGTLDNSFNGDGRQNIDFPGVGGGGGSDFGTGIRVQSDGKIVLGGSAGNDFGVARLLSNGTLDNSFGGHGNGKTTIDFNSGGIDKASDLLLLADGRIVLVGASTALSGNARNFAIAQLNPGGTPDLFFNGDGKALTDFGGDDAATAASARADGTLAVARYQDGLPVGILDRSWNGTGIARMPVPAGEQDPSAVASALQSDGKVLVTEETFNTQTLSRFNANGTVDTSFGAKGIAVLPAALGQIRRLVVQPDKKILAYGSDQTTRFKPTVVRLNSNGTIDASFGSRGVAEVDYGFDVRAEAFDIQADGKIVVGGTVIGSAASSALARFNSNGSLDTSFGKGGKLIFDLGSNDFEQVQALIIQADQKIVVAGTIGGSNGIDFAVARVNTNGTLDNSFSGDGRFSFDFGQSEEVNAIAQQRDGKLVLAGTTFNGLTDIAVLRLKSDGSLDNTFNGTGTFRVDLGGVETAEAVALAADGKIVVAGSTGHSGLHFGDGDFALVRINANGGLDPGFGIGGKTITDVGDDDGINAIALQNDGAIVTVGDSGHLGRRRPPFVLRYTGATSRVSIAGAVFNDNNRNGNRDNGDTGLPASTVFLDTNNNAVLDGGERSLLSDNNGNYNFTNLAPGTYTVRVKSKTGFTQSTPNGAVKVITVNSGASNNNNFGQTPNTPTKAPNIRINHFVLNQNQPLSLKGHLVDPDDDDTLTVKVNWGDGTTQQFHPSRSPFNIEHRYKNVPPGQYIIHSSWFDQSGAGNKQDFFVRVKA